MRRYLYAIQDRHPRIERHLATALFAPLQAVDEERYLLPILDIQCRETPRGGGQGGGAREGYLKNTDMEASLVVGVRLTISGR